MNRPSGGSASQFAITGDDAIGTGRCQRRAMRFIAMSTADEADHRHAGSPGCLDTGNAVLDDQATPRRRPHAGCRVQEEIGGRLAIDHHGGTEDVGRQAMIETDLGQRLLQSLGDRAGRVCRVWLPAGRQTRPPSAL